MTSRSLSPLSKGPTQRQLRVAEEVRHILSGILFRGEKGEELLQKTSITVTEVRLSPDLKCAKVYVMPIGGEQQEAVVKALNKSSSFYRFHLGRQLAVKFIPSLKFYRDESFDEASKIAQLLQSDRVKQDLNKDEEPSS